MVTTRALAITAYATALASPAADWRAIADQLHTALCPRADTSEANAPRWWADWKLGKTYSLGSLFVRFADGVTVRCNIAKAPGKLPRIAAACRVAIGFYRAQTGRQDVPAFAYLEDMAAAATFDPAVCSRLTAEIRRADHADAAKQASATADGIAWMRRELARRSAGLATAQAGHAELMRSPCRAALPVERGAVMSTLGAESEARVAMWQAAVTGAEGELSRMLDPTPAACRNFRPRVRPLHDEQPDPAAMWCEAVAELYGPPAAFTIGETWEAGADLPPAPTCEVAQNRKLTRNACLDWVETIDGCTPVEGIGKAAPGATGSENGPDLSTDAEPTYPLCSDDDDGAGLPVPAGYTVTALCLSDKARAALFEQIQDGTFPDASRVARAGAWRLTLADALDCQGLTSIRFVGLPRKPRARRTADVAPIALPPVVEIPVVEIHGAGASAFYLRPAVPGLVCLHAPCAL